MTTYLLLRNNKQSGPYSFDELKNMGLKAYDLVWLEGKSAAWRYPSEIDELREFAPAVEEQPFDRFFRRPGQSAPAVAAGSQGSQMATAPAGESVLTGKRIIYVNLPAGRPASMPLRETPVREVPVEKQRVPAAEARTPVGIPAFEDYPSPRDRAAASSVEFAPRNEIRLSRNRNDRLFRILAVGICILALLAAGMFIGLSLNKEDLGLQHRVVAKTAPAQVTHPVVQTQSTVQPPVTPAANSPVPANTAERPAMGPSSNTGASTADATAGHAVGKGSRTRRQKENDGTARLTMPIVTKDSNLNMPVIPRESVHRTDARSAPTSENEVAKTAIASQVSVGANDYSVGTFGGINGLQLTVTNRSSYPLDLVVVQVQYIQANKKIYKTENLNFRDIGPGSALMQEAPKSSRGIRVQCKITSISSKELGLSYSGI